MNALLIYNSNVPYTLKDSFNEFGTSVSFVVLKEELMSPYFTIDKKMSEFILNEEEIEQKQYDVIFIPYSLSEENYTEFLGLRLAYHIRLTPEFNNIQTPIVFYGLDTPWEINKLSNLGQILFTSNIFTTEEISADNFKKKIEDIKAQSSSSHQSDNLFLKDFTAKIRLKVPGNYKSHHSIANDWALARYFSMIKKENGNAIYDGLENKVYQLDYTKTLHFKYLESTEERQKFNKRKFYTPHFKKVKGLTIGIIEDEADKGWGDFYKFLFEKSDANVEIFQFHKDESKTDLINRLKKRIEEQNSSKSPIDLYVVDLRLHDEDFEEKDSDKISGNQIIKYIKSINKGIQIVVSTASNKVWNFQKNIELGVTSFIVKESPETFNTREETEQTMKNLTKEVDKAADKAFLAELYRKIESLKKYYVLDSNEKDFISLVFEEKGLLDKIFALLNIDCFNDAVLDQCLLLCFQIFENYCNLKTVGSFDDCSGCVWLKDNSEFKVYNEQPNSKISTWFELNMGKFDFQKESSSDTPIGYNEFLKMELKSLRLYASFVVKMISVLHFRENIDKADIERIMRLRYYRSNVSAHLTGRVKSDIKITAKEHIAFLIEIFEKIFIKH